MQFKDVNNVFLCFLRWNVQIRQEKKQAAKQQDAAHKSVHRGWISHFSLRLCMCAGPTNKTHSQEHRLK